MEFAKTAGGVLLPDTKLRVGGRFIGQIVRDGKVIDEFDDCNLVVNEGLDALLNIMFDGATQVTTWYLGLFEGNYTPVSTNTAATIASAATESTAYTNATRPAFVCVASSGQNVTNAASRGDFVFNATKTIYGAFLISDNTKSGTAGKLFSAARFSSSKSVVSGDELLLTYSFSAASA